jgi:hypothetical protein
VKAPAQRFDRIAVVVPARNEDILLPGCLAALRVTAAAVELSVHLLVVLDSCTDSTAEVAGHIRRAERDPRIEQAIDTRVAGSLAAAAGSSRGSCARWDGVNRRSENLAAEGGTQRERESGPGTDDAPPTNLPTRTRASRDATSRHGGQATRPARAPRRQGVR